MKKLYTAIAVLLFFLSAYAQKKEIRGNVSFISSKNVYVKFISTEGIQEGDSLFKTGTRLIPVLTAKYISATSVAGELINNTEVKTGDEISAFVNIPQTEKTDTTAAIQNMVTEGPPIAPTGKSIEFTNERIDGRFSIQSYSTFSNSDAADFQRWRYTVSFNGKNISESAISASAFLNFNYRADEWNRIRKNPAGNFRIYDLALRYDLSEKSYFMAGRHLNEKITNIGSVDGMQYQISAGNYNIGAFAGSRPDFSDLGFNLKLFQAGAYVNRTDTINSKLLDNTLAIVQQTNNFKTDRRLLYFQHSNTLINTLSLFLTAEADLYKNIHEVSSNEFSLTGLFLSARYNPFQYASLSVSYDARRNVIYYETFKNYIETLLENEMRQGFRSALNLRIIPNLFAGMNYGYRFRKGDPLPSYDFGGYLSYSLIPLIEISPSISYSRIRSAFISGNIISVTISKNIEAVNSYLSLTYRNSDYKFPQSISSIQHNISADLNTRIMRQIFLSIGWEGIFEGRRTTGRITADLTSRL